MLNPQDAQDATARAWWAVMGQSTPLRVVELHDLLPTDLTDLRLWVAGAILEAKVAGTFHGEIAAAVEIQWARNLLAAAMVRDDDGSGRRMPLSQAREQVADQAACQTIRSDRFDDVMERAACMELDA